MSTPAAPPSVGPLYLGTPSSLLTPLLSFVPEPLDYQVLTSQLLKKIYL